MALQVWLPLNGNLNNQGLTNVTVTNNGATVDNNGKIGKCYNFDGTYVSFNRPLPNPCSAFTVCGWVKLSMGYAANNGLHLVSFETSYGRICISKDGHAVRVLLNYNGTTSATGSIAAASSISANVWNHYAVTFDSGKINIYINGQLDNSYTVNISQVSITSSILKVGTYGGEPSKGYVNDFRLYDHALSPKEVKELSKGLVCHYPLNGGGRGGDNLSASSADLTRWAIEGGVGVTWDADKNMYKIVDSTHTSGRWGIYQDITISANTTYTITCTLDGNSCGVGFGFYGSSIGFPSAVITTSGTKKRESYTLTSGADSTRCRIYLYTNCATSTTAWFSLPKLEVGSIATPWIPKSTDTAYTAMGYNSTTEYDVSGYVNNGTKSGTFIYDVDTPRYSVCTNIKNAAYIKIQNLSTTGFSNSYSFAWWGKVPSYTGLMMWGFGDGMRLNGIFNGNLWNTGDGANNPLYVPGTTTQVTVPTTNVWHHWVMTGDGTTCKVYQDGELWATAKTYKSIGSGTTIYINGWDGSTNYKYNNYFMSDFRIYATALSADDIKELYDTVASVANNGTLMGYELVEV